MGDRKELIVKHGGYRQLKSFQLARLVYDVTVDFCDSHISRKSRTHDQMVQAARSGVQNIAEGSQASGTSKKMEIKLTSVARASLEELRLDYEDFLRQRKLPEYEPEHPVLRSFKKRRCSSLQEFNAWLSEELQKRKHINEHEKTQTNRDENRLTRTGSAARESRAGPWTSVKAPRPCKSSITATYTANAALSLINLTAYLLDRQIKKLAADFENHGGFTERLYQFRKNARKKPKV